MMKLSPWNLFQCVIVVYCVVECVYMKYIRTFISMYVKYVTYTYKDSFSGSYLIKKPAYKNWFEILWSDKNWNVLRNFF